MQGCAGEREDREKAVSQQEKKNTFLRHWTFIEAVRIMERGGWDFPNWSRISRKMCMYVLAGDGGVTGDTVLWSLGPRPLQVPLRLSGFVSSTDS